MCGIAGWCLDPKHSNIVSRADLTGQMLMDIEHRGTDATGAAWINPQTGKRGIRKAAISATKFLQSFIQGLQHKAHLQIQATITQSHEAKLCSLTTGISATTGNCLNS